jgi:hypothetical protein
MSVRCELSEMRESTATFGCAAGFGRVGDMRGGAKAAAGSAGGDRGGVHRFGVPPKGDANFAWVQDFSRHVAPNGMAGGDCICPCYTPAGLANGSMSSNQTREGDVRRAHFEADREMSSGEMRTTNRCLHPSNFDSLPGQLFCRTGIPVYLWFFAKNMSADAKRGFRDRRDVDS